MNKLYFIIVLILCAPFVSIAQDNYWKPGEPIQSSSKIDFSKLSSYRSFQFDLGKVQSHIAAAPRADKNYKTEVDFKINLPNPEGALESFRVMEIQVLSAELAKEYPNIKTYKILGNHGGSGRITLSDFGMEVFVNRGEGSYHITAAEHGNAVDHIIYYDRDNNDVDYHCSMKDMKEEINSYKMAMTPLGDCQLRSYRVAVTTTGEYTSWAGSQAAALTEITTTINNIGDIFERDATITFTVVSTNAIIYTNAASDPFTTTSFPNSAALNDCHSAITSALTTAGFDIGHVFHQGGSGGSGLAQLNAVCSSTGKGRAASRSSNPTGSGWERLVAHEIAHNFSATHTMPDESGGCSGNVTTATAVEIGGGSTIMAYAFCPNATYQNSVDGYFHTVSASQIINYSVNSATCASTSSSNNSNPTVTAEGPSYSIPASTPFLLSATGSDPDGNTILYNWEQFDAVSSATNGFPSSTATTGAMFRSYPPSEDGNNRYCPNLSDLVAGNSFGYEVLPSVTRTMNFRITARDQAPGSGCLATDETIVSTVGSAGPFEVTSQSSATSWTANGTNAATIIWNVASTNATPINCTQVDILFSEDGGLTYPHVLLANTPNDGSESIIIPNLNVCSGRIMVKASNNIFFNINDADIAITTSCGAEGANFSPSSNLLAVAGDAALSFTESTNYGSSIASFSGSLTSTDPASNLTFSNTGNCANGGNSVVYDTYEFEVNVSGLYSFTRTSGDFGTVMNLYSSSYDNNNRCTNFMASSATSTGGPVTLGSTISNVDLCSGVTYVMVVTSFSGTLPTLPSSYVISASSTPSGGGLYSGAPSPGAGFSYSYVIVDNTTGLIKEFTNATVDMTNTGQYPSGTYSIYGVSHVSSSSLSNLNTTYAGTLFASFQSALLNSTLCANLSSNLRSITVLTAPLPVEMSALEGAAINSHSVLNWTTYQETNTSHFEIQRSPNGQDYEKIGEIAAAGQSRVQIDYRFVDEQPLGAKNYYRLKNVDMDGQLTFSNVVDVYHRIDRTILQSIYPNPTKDVVNLKLLSASSDKTKVVISDMLGHQVLVKDFNVFVGEQVIELDVSSLASGNYMIKLSNQDIAVNSKLTIR